MWQQLEGAVASATKLGASEAVVDHLEGRCAGHQKFVVAWGDFTYVLCILNSGDGDNQYECALWPCVGCCRVRAHIDAGAECGRLVLAQSLASRGQRTCSTSRPAPPCWPSPHRPTQRGLRCSARSWSTPAHPHRGAGSVARLRTRRRTCGTCGPLKSELPRGALWPRQSPACSCTASATTRTATASRRSRTTGATSTSGAWLRCCVHVCIHMHAAHRSL